MALSASEKNKARREKHKESGLVSVELWITPANKAILKAFESEMRLRTIENLTCGEDL